MDLVYNSICAPAKKERRGRILQQHVSNAGGAELRGLERRPVSRKSRGKEREDWEAEGRENTLGETREKEQLNSSRGTERTGRRISFLGRCVTPALGQLVQLRPLFPLASGFTLGFSEEEREDEGTGR